MSIFLELPQETVDALVDYLHDTEGRQQMRVCSLIHRSFIPRAQYYLFSKIRFSSDNAPRGKKRTQRIRHFNEILRRKPHIAEFVRVIHLCLSPSDAEWITEDSNFLDTMRLLASSGCAPRKFVVEKTGYLWSPIILNPRTFMTEFVQEVVAPTVTSLEIRGMQGVPADFISLFTNLKTLVVDSVVFDAPGLDIPPTSYLPILHLDLRGQLERVPEISGLTNTQGIHGLDLTHLNCLKASITSHTTWQIVNGILSLAAKHLQLLCLVVNDGYVKIMDIYQLKRLRVLKLHFSTQREFLLQLSEVIHSLPSDGPLKELHVQVDIDVSVLSREEFIGASDQWTRLDASLCAISSQKEFRYTCLIHPPYQAKQFELWIPELLTIIKGNLPLASATPNLSMYHDIESMTR